MSRTKRDKVADALIDRFGDETPLNRRAFFAVKGFTIDWKNDLIALLRSEEPIHWAVREVLAEAIESETIDGTRLELIGGGKNTDNFRAIAARESWVRIGRWIDLRIAEGLKRKDAIPLAEKEFGASHEKCRDALTYSRRCKEYVANTLSESPLSPHISEEMLEHAFHYRHIEEERNKKSRCARGSAPGKQ